MPVAKNISGDSCREGKPQRGMGDETAVPRWHRQVYQRSDASRTTPAAWAAFSVTP
jgi:hypothetical protein